MGSPSKHPAQQAEARRARPGSRRVLAGSKPAPPRAPALPSLPCEPPQDVGELGCCAGPAARMLDHHTLWWGLPQTPHYTLLPSQSLGKQLREGGLNPAFGAGQTGFGWAIVSRRAGRGALPVSRPRSPRGLVAGGVWEWAPRFFNTSPPFRPAGLRAGLGEVKN